MRTRSEVATAPVLATSPATARWELRPRQAPGARCLPAGAAVPCTAPRMGGGRVTRSSAQANPSSGSSAAPRPEPLRTTRQSHKRPASPSAAAARRRAKRARRRSRPSGELQDESDSGDGADIAGGSQSSDVEQPATPSRSSGRRARTGKPSPARPAQRSPGRPAAGKPPRREECDTTVGDGVIPDWASLPYHVLAQIFRFAAAALVGEHTDERAKWLPAASRVCRAFAEPALTALYVSPPLLNRSMAHGLVALLSKDPSTTLFNYRPKVEELIINVEEIASKSYKGQPLDLRALLGNLPRLRVVQFFHWKDDPPFQRLDESLRWHYPAVLFQALNGVQGATEAANGAQHAKLTAWQWNRRLMGPDLDLSGIKALHQTPSFSRLKKLSFVNFQVPSLHARANADVDELEAQDRAFIQRMADAIASLPTLEHLCIESSTAASGELLALLPADLKTLELVNCWEVDGDDFASYLLSNGYKLEHLVLRHNQSLDLTFLTVLGAACPNLKTLCMDFKTFNHHKFSHDSNPDYETLLAAGQVPDWPEGLESVELKNMRKWTAEAAETLFQSLVDSAPKLRRLRRLDLKAMLDIPYRQRSEIRDRWAATLKHVFLREAEDPRPVYSLRQQQAPSSATDESSALKKKPSKKSRRSARLAPESPSRRSSRIAMQQATPSPSSRASSVGRELRNGLNRPSYVEPDTDMDEDDEEEEDDDDDDIGSGHDNSHGQPASPAETAGAVPFRHGLCEMVELQLDNQKPAERTWRMEDFLDDEDDDLSDEDWDGDDEELDVGYAW